MCWGRVVGKRKTSEVKRDAGSRRALAESSVKADALSRDGRLLEGRGGIPGIHQYMQTDIGLHIGSRYNGP